MDTLVSRTIDWFKRSWQPLLAMFAAFVVYYCMYACRKPFAAVTWQGSFFGTQIDLKTALAVSQILGYATAKLIGTWICSSLGYRRIWPALVGCIVASLASLLLLPFAGEFKFAAMFLNGLSLGMVWGFVMRPLEGRELTEMLIAGLCVSFIIASGDVKSTGQWLIETEFFTSRFGDNEAWMPFLTGLLYFPFLLVASIVLFALPQPNKEDQIARSSRRSMNSDERWLFIRHHWLLLVPLAVAYFLLTAYRDFRDTFQAEIFQTLGINESTAFSTSERYVAFGVIAILSIFVLIKQSRLALVVCHWVMALGLIFCGLVTFMMKLDLLGGYWWMVLAGLGAYLTYIAFHCIVFERLVAYTRAPGNASYAMMVFDSIGYVAAILFMMVKTLFSDSNHMDVLVGFTWVLMIGGAGSIFTSLWMVRRLQVFEKPATTETSA